MSVQEIPTRLVAAEDNKHELQKWDVYFDGKKQTQCIVADVGKGFIERYKSMFGVRISRGGRPLKETLYGKVLIVPTGTALAAGTPLQCEKAGVAVFCKNSDVRLVQLRDSVTSGTNDTNSFKGPIVGMCAECRKCNRGCFKFYKDAT